MTMTTISEAPPSFVLACGDCAGEMIRAGGTWAPVKDIAQGAVCQVHPRKKLPRVATNAIVAAEGWDRTSLESTGELPAASTGEVEAARPSEPFRLPPEVGPLTELSARFIVARLEADPSATAPADVSAAVTLAVELLKATGGQ